MSKPPEALAQAGAERFFDEPELPSPLRDRAYDAAIPDRVRALALDIAHRLRPVCASMPDAELLALTTRIAMVELQYFERGMRDPRPMHAVGR
jgi:hypothetical protein